MRLGIQEWGAEQAGVGCRAQPSPAPFSHGTGVLGAKHCERGFVQPFTLRQGAATPRELHLDGLGAYGLTLCTYVRAHTHTHAAGVHGSLDGLCPL